MPSYKVTLKFSPEKASPDTKPWERDTVVSYVSAMNLAAAIQRACTEVITRPGLLEAEGEVIQESVLY